MAIVSAPSQEPRDIEAAVDEAMEADRKVTSLELFFDLVFVFALTQVTALLAADPTALGLLRGTAVLAALWWAWVGYSWVGTVVDAEDGATRIVFLTAMAAMMIAAIAVPGAFGDDGVLFGISYLVVRVLQVALLIVSGRGDPGVARAARRLSPALLTASILILIAGFLPAGVPRGLCWTLALIIDIAGPLVTGTRGWKVSPGHFAERHGLIVIIALGEALVAIGAAVGVVKVAPLTVVGIVMGVALAAVLWWLYFDVVAPVATRRLERADRDTRAALARDSYSYLHFFFVLGIVLVALAFKKAIPALDSPLSGFAAMCLGVGLAIYLLAHVAFRLRNIGSVNRQRLLVALLYLAMIPLALNIPAWQTLVAVTVVAWLLVAYEVVVFREWRHTVRSAH